MKCCNNCGDRVVLGTSIKKFGKEIGPYCLKYSCQEAMKNKVATLLQELLHEERLCKFKKLATNTCGMNGVPAIEHGMCPKHAQLPCYYNDCAHRGVQECLGCEKSVCENHRACTDHAAILVEA